MPLSNGTIQIIMTAAESVVNPGGSSDVHGASFSGYFTLTDGTGAGTNFTQGFAQKVADKQVATSVSITNLDLTAFAGGINGAAINLSKVKWLLIRNLDATNSVTVTFNGTNGFTNAINGTVTVAPGDFLLLDKQTAGMVVDATHKIVGLTAAAGTPLVQVTCVGEGV